MRQEVCWVNIYQSDLGRQWAGHSFPSREDAHIASLTVASKLLYRIKITRKD